MYDAANQTLTLTDAGLFIVERCPAFGVCLSYRPMLHALPAALHGDAAAVFTYTAGHEAWVDRKLNVIGSGFMHNRYFSDMMRVQVHGMCILTRMACMGFMHNRYFSDMMRVQVGRLDCLLIAS